MQSEILTFLSHPSLHACRITTCIEFKLIKIQIDIIMAKCIEIQGKGQNKV